MVWKGPHLVGISPWNIASRLYGDLGIFFLKTPWWPPWKKTLRNPGSRKTIEKMEFKALLEEEDDEDRIRFFFGVESTTGFLVMPGHAVKRTYGNVSSTVEKPRNQRETQKTTPRELEVDIMQVCLNEWMSLCYNEAVSHCIHLLIICL